MCLQINLYLQRKHWQNWKVVQKSFSCGLAMVITISGAESYTGEVYWNKRVLRRPPSV